MTKPHRCSTLFVVTAIIACGGKESAPPSSAPAAVDETRPAAPAASALPSAHAPADASAMRRELEVDDVLGLWLRDDSVPCPGAVADRPPENATIDVETEGLGGWELTIEAWVRHPNDTVLRGGTGTDAGLAIHHERTLRVRVAGQVLDSTVNLDDDTWHHVALTWRAVDSQLVLVVDGRVRARTVDEESLELDALNQLQVGPSVSALAWHARVLAPNRLLSHVLVACGDRPPTTPPGDHPIVFRNQAEYRGYGDSMEFSPDGRSILLGGGNLWDVATGLLVRRLGHEGAWVNALDISPDGRWAAGTRSDGSTLVWDIAAGTVLHRLAGHDGGVVRARFSPDGRMVATAGTDGRLMAFRARDGAKTRTFAEGGPAIERLAYSPDGELIASAGEDRVVRLWEAGTGRLRAALRPHEGRISGIAFSPSGTRLLTAGWDNEVRLWDTATGEQLWAHRPDGPAFVYRTSVLKKRSSNTHFARYRNELIGHAGPVSRLRFSADGSQLISGGESNEIKVWDVDSGRRLRSYGGDFEFGEPQTLSTDGRLVLSRRSNGEKIIWDVGGDVARAAFSELPFKPEAVAFGPRGWVALSADHPKDQDGRVELRSIDGSRRHALRGHAVEVRTLLFSPDGERLVTGDEKGVVKLWDVASGRLLYDLAGYRYGARAAAFSRDGALIATRGEGDLVIISRTRDGREVTRLDLERRRLVDIEFSADATHLLALGFDAIADVVRIEDGQRVLRVEGLGRYERPAGLSPDGRLLATAHEDGTVRLWDARSGAARRELQGHTGDVRVVRFSADGRTLASGGRDTSVRLWRVPDGKLLHEMSGATDWIEAAAYDPTGNTVATAHANGSTRIWSAEDGRLLHTLAGHDDVVSVVGYTGDGETVATGSWDRSIATWSLGDGERRAHVPNAHPAEVRHLATSPGGRRLATGSRDSTVRLWDVATGQRLPALTRHKAFSEAEAVTPDGCHLISASAGAVATLWDVCGGRLAHALEGHTRPIRAVAITNDGRWVATGSDDKTVRLWDGITGKLVHSFAEHERGIATVAFDAQGTRLAAGETGFRDLIAVWEVPSGKLIARHVEERGLVSHLHFAPRSEGVVFANRPGKIQVLDIASASIVRSIDGRGTNQIGFPTISLAVSPDGRLVASGTFDSHVGVWNLDTGERRWDLDGHDGPVVMVPFSPNSETLATVDAQGTVRRWSMRDGRALAPLEEAPMRPAPGSLAVGFPLVTVQFRAGGEQLLSSRWDGTLRIWDAQSGRLAAAPHHDCVPQTAALLNDGATAVTGCRDGSVRVRRIDTDDELRMLSRGREWVIYTPDGIFDSSPGGARIVAATQGTRAFGIDQLALRNNRPDHIFERFGLGTPAQRAHFAARYQRRLRRAGLRESDLSDRIDLPEAHIIALRPTDSESRVELRYALRDRQALARHQIWINDVPLLRGFGAETEGHRALLSRRIRLTGGTNKIEVSAINARGQESMRALTFVRREAEPAGDLYFLGFGVSRYRDATLNLSYAHKDALDLASVLRRTKTFRNVHVRTLTDQQVTRDAIRTAKGFVAQANPEDTFVLFIAGHGVHDRDDAATYYFLTHEADIDDLAHTAASFEMIEELLLGIRPRNKLFLMDTCESGEADERVEAAMVAQAGARGLRARTGRPRARKASRRERARRPFLTQADRFIDLDLIRRSGAIVFSASQGGELSYETREAQNGLFTDAILEALTTTVADGDADGQVSTDELRRFVSRAVSERSDNLQNPTVDRDNIYQRFAFPIVR